MSTCSARSGRAAAATAFAMSTPSTSRPPARENWYSPTRPRCCSGSARITTWATRSSSRSIRCRASDAESSQRCHRPELTQHVDEKADRQNCQRHIEKGGAPRQKNAARKRQDDAEHKACKHEAPSAVEMHGVSRIARRPAFYESATSYGSSDEAPSPARIAASPAQRERSE